MDYVNAMFELGMAFCIFLSIRKLCKDRQVKGIHWANVAFPMLWGLFNIVYYPSLEQHASFFAGVVVVAMNAAYLYKINEYRDRG